MRNSLLEWIEPPDPDPTAVSRLCEALDISELLARILVQRGVDTVAHASAFLSPQRYTPSPPEELPDLVQAALLLQEAIAHGQRILVWGDFDVDGQTSTALLVDGLRGLGAEVDFYIPNRLKEGHGILPESLERELERVRPALLLTCDTGVSARQAIDYAKTQGLTTIITDHHDLPPTLPAADAIINPKRLPAEHPLVSLPGVGVAYKLIEHLYAASGRPREAEQFLDLVALGIVADVAVQTHDTRYLLQRGLERLRAPQRPGLQALMQVAGLQAERLSAEDIGFQLGPRLNAAGRLADARLSVELFTTRDPSHARVLAEQLDALNNQRRRETRQIYIAAQEMIARDPSLLDWEALVLARPNWHTGIIGIVAGRLAEQYARPVVLFSMGTDGIAKGIARGSARSAPGYDIGAAIAAQADLLLHYGGHPGAAGASLPEKNIPAFRRRLSQTLRDTHDPSVRPGLRVDAYLPLEATTLDLVRQINRLAPFGEGNPPITFVTRNLHLRSTKILGRTHEHRRLEVEDAAGTTRSVVWWRGAEHPLPEGVFDLAYQIGLNTYKGKQELQITLQAYRPAEGEAITVERPRRQVLDWRTDDPQEALARALEAHPEATVWAEGYRRAESPGATLPELPPNSVLVIYTAPPSPRALQEALERVKPQTLILIGVAPPSYDRTKTVIERLWQLIHYVSAHEEGRTTLSALAGATAQRLETMRLALEYTAARGEVAVEFGRGGTVQLYAEEGRPQPEEIVKEKFDALRRSIAESNAYRAYFRRAPLETLLGENYAL